MRAGYMPSTLCGSTLGRCRKAITGGGPTLMGYPAIQMAVDLDRISALLKEHLSPLQEKVVRLYFGLGCSRSFSAAEIARELRVSRQMVSGIVGGAQTKLAPVGLTSGL